MRTSSYRDEFERIKEVVSLREYADAHLERRGRQYVCPACGSGTHANGTPALSITPDGSHWKCFSCGTGGDVFDLAGAIAETSDKREQLSEVANWAGLSAEPESRPHRREKPHRATVAEAKERMARIASEAARRKANREAHAEAVRRARERIGDPVAVSYLASRGITLEQAREWGLGYAERSTRYRTPHIVIPYPGNEWYHADRSIRPDLTPWKYFKWPADEVGPEPLWNPNALDGSLIVLVEGQLDALAVQSCGFEAVACGGHGTKALLAEMERRHWTGVALLMFDADDSGMDASARLGLELDRTPGVTAWPFWRWPEEGRGMRFKDPAEWFAADRDGMAEAIAETAEEETAFGPR